jgi:hypothetical protein
MTPRPASLTADERRVKERMLEHRRPQAFAGDSRRRGVRFGVLSRDPR